ncbi:Pepco domain-containing protein [Streptomyces sp. NPDC003863]
MTEASAPSDEPALPIWVSYDEEAGSREDDTMGLFGSGGESEPALRSVPLGPLRKNLAETVDALQQVFSEAAARGGTLPLREAHLSFQVTAGGGIQLIGTAQAQSSRGIVLVFKQ